MVLEKHWLFHHKKDLTLATLTGIMLGSLNKIWPWRNPLILLDKETGQQVSFSDNAMLISFKRTTSREGLRFLS